MNLTLTHAGSRDPDGSLSFSWSIDADDGTRWAEQSGHLAGYPPSERTALAAEIEGLLAALEWLHPLQYARPESIALRPSPEAAAEIARPHPPDEDTPAARVAAYLSLFRKRGVAVEVLKLADVSGRSHHRRLTTAERRAESGRKRRERAGRAATPITPEERGHD